MPHIETKRFDCYDWNDALRSLDDAAETSLEVSFQNLFWRPLLTPPIVIKSTYTVVRSLSLRGNDILSLLSLVYLPNLESLTLKFARALLDENGVERPSPFDSVVSCEPLDSCGSQSQNADRINNCYDLLVEFLRARSGRHCQKLRSLAVHDPFITTTTFVALLSKPQIQEIPSVSIGGLPDLLSQMTILLTQHIDAYKLLGGAIRSHSPRVGVWYYPLDIPNTQKCTTNSKELLASLVYDPEIDEAFLGWNSRKSEGQPLSKTLLEYDTKTGEVFWPSGRYHRIIRSF